MRVEHGHFKSLFKTFQAKQLNKMKEATGIGKYIHQLIPPPPSPPILILFPSHITLRMGMHIKRNYTYEILNRGHDSGDGIEQDKSERFLENRLDKTW